jgi:hypothetical protein
MWGNAPIRITFVLLVASSAFCQTSIRQTSLPDAPTAQALDRPEILRAFVDTARLPATTLSPANAPFRLKYDPLHLEAETNYTEPSHLTPWTPAVLKRRTPLQTSTSNSLLGRGMQAATSIVVTRDDEGHHQLNTPYLLRVLTMATAHVADRPYWRRSASQPFSDVGSTVGNDAGLKVLHEFQPGLLQVVRNHEPRFVSKIEERVRQK